MGYDVPKNKDAFLKLCEEGGANFPYSEDVSILAESVKVGNKVAPNRIAYQAMTEGMGSVADDFVLAEGGIITINTETAAALNIDYKAAFGSMGSIVEVATTAE